MSMKKKGFEVRLDDDGSIDEVLVEFSNGYFHLERMDNGYFWAGITLPNKKRIHLDLTSRGKIKASIRED